MIFVDTGAWFALFVDTDPNSGAARGWIDESSEPLVTSDYVVDELVTLLRVRGKRARAIDAGKQLFSETVAEIEFVTDEDVRYAWQLFQAFDDKDWSFTDCISRVVMERLNITSAFAFDDHFRQFGTVSVVP